MKIKMVLQKQIELEKKNDFVFEYYKNSKNIEIRT